MERFEELEQLLAKRCPTLELRKNESMERNTSFHVGGPARLMALPRTKEEAKSALLAAAELGIEPFFLGNGTNLLVPDRGVERLLYSAFCTGSRRSHPSCFACRPGICTPCRVGGTGTIAENSTPTGMASHGKIIP